MSYKTLKINKKKQNISIVNKTLKNNTSKKHIKGNLNSWQCFLKKRVPRMKGDRVHRIKQASQEWRKYSEKDKEKYMNCKNKTEELNKLIEQLDLEINRETSIPELGFTEKKPDLEALEKTVQKCIIIIETKMYNKVSNFNIFMSKFNEASNIIETHRINKDISIVDINDELHNEDQSPEKLNKIKSRAILNDLNGHIVEMLNIRETQLNDIKNKIEKYQEYDKMSIHDLSFECQKLKKYIDTIKTKQKNLLKTDLFHKLETIYNEMTDYKNKQKETTVRNKSKHLRTITHKIKTFN